MFAIIRTGGKQYRVAEQDLITVDKISGQPGDAVQFGEVLLVGGDNVMIGSPMVSGATVAGEVVEQGRGKKVIAFKKRRRKNSRRKRGFRPEFTLVRITEILTDGQAPTMTASVRKPNRKPAPAEVLAEADAADEAAAAPRKGKAKGSPKAAKKPAKPPARKAQKSKSARKK